MYNMRDDNWASGHTTRGMVEGDRVGVGRSYRDLADKRAEVEEYVGSPKPVLHENLKRSIYDMENVTDALIRLLDKINNSPVISKDALGVEEESMCSLRGVLSVGPNFLGDIKRKQLSLIEEIDSLLFTV
jgi:hypothetical protein